MGTIYTKEQEFHIGVSAGQIGRYVILPGDPGRCKKIAEHFEEAKLIAQNREYVTYTGFLNGEMVSVCSTGIGGPSASIALEELIHVGADTFIRVGTAGGMQLDIQGGDLVIPTAAIRFEGTTKEYAPMEYPAVPSYDIVSALKDSSERLGYCARTGVIHCKDSFYGQHTPEDMPVANELEYKWNAFIKCGALASEMESAALYIVGSIRQVRVGSVILVVANQMREQSGLSNPQKFDTEAAIMTAIEALKDLIEKDKKKNA